MSSKPKLYIRNSEATLLAFKYHVVHDPIFIKTIIDLRKSDAKSYFLMEYSYLFQSGTFVPRA